MNTMRKLPVLPNIVTAFALTCGLFVIFKMNMTPVGAVDIHVLTATAGLLLLSAFADLIDGALARALKAESSFGGLFDSLADVITFGVGPSIIVLKSLSIPPGTVLSFFLTAAAMIYTVCGVLRLVRFNVINLRDKDNPELVLAGKKNFTGLPIPAGAAAVVSANLVLVSEEMRSLLTMSEETRAWLLFCVLILIGYFMISRWKFPSLKTLRIRVASFQLVLITVIIAVMFFYGILNHFPVMFAATSWGYLIVAWGLSIIRMVTGKDVAILDDFEPDNEEMD
ncbi:MAG: CDP-alcohol phosphatidyltransferase family protein [Parachlamydiaceae bacterium]